MGSMNDMPKLIKTAANGYRTIVETAYGKDRDYRTDIFTIEKTDMFEERDMEIGGIGEFEVWLENQAAPLDDIREGFEVRYRQVSYGKRIPFGRLQRKFMMMSERRTKRAMELMGVKAYEHEQRSAFELLSKGFDTTFANGYGDGKPTFSTLHPLSPHNNTSWSNALANSAPVGETALMDMIKLLDSTPDDMGNKLHLGKYGYIWIVTNLDDYFTALRIVAPDADLRPGTSNNDINLFNGEVRGMSRPITLVYNPFAENTAYPNAHFLVAKREASLNILVSESFYTDSYMDDDSDTLFVRGRFMYARGLGSPRGIVGSRGNSVAYAS